MENDKETRLAAMIGGARQMHCLIDPEQTSGAAILDRFEVDTATMSWSARLRREDAGSLNLTGFIIDGCAPIISGAFVKSEDGTITEIPVMPSKKLVLSLVKGGRVPGPAKLFVGKNGPLSEQKDKEGRQSFIKDYLTMARDALFWGVEPAKKEQLREMNKYAFRFDHDEYGSPIRVYLYLTAVRQEGRIWVEADIDPVGLGNKKVFLKKNLGMLHNASTECNARIDNRRVASLKVAFDLYDAIPVLYQTEINENVTPTVKKRGPKPSRK